MDITKQSRFGLFALVVSVCLGACTTTMGRDYTSYREADPRKIAIMPFENVSELAEAGELVRTRFEIGLAQRGYEIAPTAEGDNALEERNSESGNSQNDHADPIDCDAYLNGVVNSWEVAGTWKGLRKIGLTVDLRSCRDDSVIWSYEKMADYSIYMPDGTNTYPFGVLSLLGEIVGELMEPIDPPESTAAFHLVQDALGGNDGVPYGPISKNYLKDMMLYGNYPETAPWRGVQVFRANEEMPSQFQSLGEIQGVSCTKVCCDQPTEEHALLDTRVKAAELGADGIVNVSCKLRKVGMQCWRSLTCDAEAILIQDAG